MDETVTFNWITEFRPDLAFTVDWALQNQESSYLLTKTLPFQLFAFLVHSTSFYPYPLQT